MPKVKVSSRFQIVIPKEVREELKIKRGQTLIIAADGFGGITLGPRPDFRKLRGIFKGIPNDFEREKFDREL
jgi:AbrB family looped-hinge helix DNA binding protein